VLFVTIGFTTMNRIVNGALHDVAHRIYQGVSCFQNITCFNDSRINVNIFIPMRKLQSFPASTFTKPTNAHRNRMQTSYTKFHPYWTIGVKGTDRNSITPLSKACFFLRRFLQTSKLLKRLLWEFLYWIRPNFSITIEIRL
jgi:hypothetical protein